MAKATDEQKKQATELGIKFNPNIGEDKLQKRIDEALATKNADANKDNTSNESDDDQNTDTDNNNDNDELDDDGVGDGISDDNSQTNTDNVKPGTAQVQKEQVKKSKGIDNPIMPEESAAQRRARKVKECNRLVRVIITPMNPAKREWDGEIFTASNSIIGTIRKFVPFNNEEGFHVPQLILNVIRERKVQIFTTKKLSNGKSIRQGKQISEFVINELDPLTAEEINDLRITQAMREGNTE